MALDLQTAATGIPTILGDVMPPSLDHRTTVLVVDDDDDLRSALVECLQEAGFEVTEAPDGAAALASLEGVVADVIVVDLQMPRMGGLEFLRRWNAARAGASAVILMTGSEPLVDPPAGSVAILRKPFSLARLVEVVQRCLGSAELHD